MYALRYSFPRAFGPSGNAGRPTLLGVTCIGASKTEVGFAGRLDLAVGDDRPFSALGADDDDTARMPEDEVFRFAAVAEETRHSCG